eukprot:1181807-Prorocentrum_minimum.AAC.2
MEPRKGPLEAGLQSAATHEPSTEIHINIRKRRGKATKNVAEKRRAAHESLLRFRTRDRRIYNITRAIGQRLVKDGEGHPHIQYLVDWEVRQPDGSRYPSDWINSGDIAEGDTMEVRPLKKRNTDPAKWRVKVADEGEHAHRTFLKVTGQTHDERTQQEKTIRDRAFRRHHTDGSADDRRRMPYRVEWDDSDESDEESDLIIDPEDEHYHITIDEEQGEGPVPDEPLSSAINRDRITNRGDRTCTSKHKRLSQTTTSTQ